MEWQIPAPIGLATPDYATPMRGDLLWVYEGMTQYWGDVLATRCGLWTPEQFKEALALTAANLDQKPGRTWRNLEDTAIAAQILRATRRATATGVAARTTIRKANCCGLMPTPRSDSSRMDRSH